MSKRLLRTFGWTSVSILIFVCIIWILLPSDLARLVKFDQNFRTGLSLISITLEDIEEHNPPEQSDFDALEYDLNIQLFPERKFFSGFAELKVFREKKKAGLLPLNFSSDLAIERVSVGKKSVDYRHENDLLQLQIPADADTFTVSVEYSGNPGRGLLFGETPDGYLIYSLNEPIFAPYWYPCIDSPSDKALYEFIIENDSDYVSIANGNMAESFAEGNRKSFHWVTQYPTATYLAAIYSGKYISIKEKAALPNSDTISFEYFVLEENFEDAKSDFSVNPEAISIYSDLFSPYPFHGEKYGVIEFLWNAGAIEHQTATGIGSNFISGLQMHTDILVHELAHSWWGNSVTPKSWADVWLNEGFASYCEALYWEAKSGASALRSTMQSKKESFPAERLYSPKSFLFSRTIYDKGAWVLHMLRRKVGDKLFLEIMRNYYSEFKYKNASTADFARVAEKTSRLKLKKFFDQWVFTGTGIIELNYSASTIKSNDRFITTVVLEQTQEQYELYSFPIDLKFSSGGSERYFSAEIDELKTNLVFETDFNPVQIELDPDGWLLAEIHKMIR